VGTALTWSRLADRTLEVEGVEIELLEQENSSGFRRLTTEVRLFGGGEVGCGEDVTYSARDQEAHAAHAATLPLGRTTLAGFSRALDAVELWPGGPELEQYRPYRRWAYESAALDLALRQAGTSLPDALGIEPRPVRFVASTGLGSPPSLAPLERLLARNSDLRFKLDTSNDWDDELVAALFDLGRVDAVDFKGAYRGTPVDQVPDPGLYARVIDGLPDCLLEDPADDPRIEPLLARCRDRVTWDAPIHDAGDVLALAHRPRTINAKPSRAGTLERVFGLYDACRAWGIETYGGGQFELGCGRGQIQVLASLFHPDEPNDVAPAVYNRPDGDEPLPPSPLEVRCSRGFRLD
jgi:hypothetical protein